MRHYANLSPPPFSKLFYKDIWTQKPLVISDIDSIGELPQNYKNSLVYQSSIGKSLLCWMYHIKTKEWAHAHAHTQKSPKAWRFIKACLEAYSIYFYPGLGDRKMKVNGKAGGGICFYERFIVCSEFPREAKKKDLTFVQFFTDIASFLFCKFTVLCCPAQIYGIMLILNSPILKTEEPSCKRISVVTEAAILKTLSWN